MQNTWIWLPEDMENDYQTCRVSALTEVGSASFCVAEFTREYAFSQKVRSLRLLVSGDTSFRLYLNGRLLVTGPASVGGDFIGNDTPREQYYAWQMDVPVEEHQLHFTAQVMLSPVQICEYSMGHGGFMLRGEAALWDGTSVSLRTDESWLCRRLPFYAAPRTFDHGFACGAFVPAVSVPDIWHARVAPIPPRTEWTLCPETGAFELQPFESKTVRIPFDKIYAGFLQVTTDGAAHMMVHCREIDEAGTTETLHFSHGDTYRGFYLHSAGELEVQANNPEKTPVHIRLSLIATHYPCPVETKVETGSTDLDLVMDVCRHTLKYCRQTHHLDSPRHTEPLACTGDYYIESLMTLFSFGDMRLAAFDLMRTARMLERHDGRMFHTAYSLIWVLMLRDVYLFTGDQALLQDCEKGLDLLLARFDGYLDAEGLIDTPPDYMFVDWIYLDGHSLHHPPKALGQSCLNMYYFGALDAAAEIYRWLGRGKDAALCLEKKQSLGRAIHVRLFDEEAQAYTAGLNTPTPESLLDTYMPVNTDKRYILKHANILAACFGVCDDERARSLIHRIMREEIPGSIQPYFTHFLLEAVFRLGLREQYTLPIIQRWIEPVQQCFKGLVEGFVKPEPTYSFDHSHAWGGTPLYSLPKALLGLRVLAPGMGELALQPSLLGLSHARFTLHTPHGPVMCTLDEGKAPCITHPDAVHIHMDRD